jgi:thiaminase
MKTVNDLLDETRTSLQNDKRVMHEDKRLTQREVTASDESYDAYILSIDVLKEFYKTQSSIKKCLDKVETNRDWVNDFLNNQPFVEFCKVYRTKPISSSKSEADGLLEIINHFFDFGTVA